MNINELFFHVNGIILLELILKYEYKSHRSKTNQTQHWIVFNLPPFFASQNAGGNLLLHFF